METMRSHVKLGVEELCLAIGLVDKPEVAKVLLYSTFGEMSPEEERGRLLAAGHSLMARNLLFIRDGQSHLVDDLKELLSTLVDNDFVIHCNQEADGIEQVLAYFVKGTTVLEQWVEQDVVYRLSPVPSTEEVVADSLRFFGIQESESFSYPDVEVSVSVIGRAKEAANEAPETILEIFQNAGVPDALCRPLSEDFRHSEYHGSVIRIEKDREGQLGANKGFLVLKGTKRIWLFPLILRDGKGYARLLPGTPDSFTRELHQLTA